MGRCPPFFQLPRRKSSKGVACLACRNLSRENEIYLGADVSLYISVGREGCQVLSATSL